MAFYVMLTDGPERELSSGMYAFGDSLLFMAAARIFMAPFLAAAFGLAVLIAPEPGFRWWMFAAASMEVATSVYGAFRWFVPMLFGN